MRVKTGARKTGTLGATKLSNTNALPRVVPIIAVREVLSILLKLEAFRTKGRCGADDSFDNAKLRLRGLCLSQ